MAQKCKNTSILVGVSEPQFLRRVFAATLGTVLVIGSIGIAGQVIPNDLCGEYWPMQWHLHNTGQSDGTPDADINAPEAWEITTGDPNIVIAVLDTGVDLNHPDLVNNLVPGYDFLDNDDSPDPVVGSHFQAPHGTACAGLVAAQGNNGIGVVGVTWSCKIMPVRIALSPSATANVTATAIRWAASNGADVISCSSVLSTDSPIINSAITDVTGPGGIGRDGRGCIVVFSAENSGALITGFKERSDVIAVGATDDHDRRLSFSNYGPGLDIVAPAGDAVNLWVMTTDITGIEGYLTTDYTGFSHTSGACPIVAGVAALILSVEPELTSEEVRHFLTRSAKDLGDAGRDDYYGWGRVDAQAALDMVLAERADLNNNWKVDFEDLVMLIEFWGMAESSVDIAPAAKR
ncbi:MAG: S8 family peptidase, partial [Planctomycetota bacterium]